MYNKIAFKTADSDEYKVLNCGENAYNVTAYRLEMIPTYPMDIDFTRLFAVFGDNTIDKASVAAHCGRNSSEGCPPDEIDRKLIGKIPGVQDTMLPSSMFKVTNRAKVTVMLERD